MRMTAKDIVLFDLPGLAQACALAMRLGSRWPCHAYQEPDTAVVGVYLAPERGWELAPLLREVQDWLAERAVTDVTFWVDGRGYLLRFIPFEQKLEGTPEQQAARINAAMEALIARCPAQYFWSYNRYKLPPGATAPESSGHTGLPGVHGPAA